MRHSTRLLLCAIVSGLCLPAAVTALAQAPPTPTPVNTGTLRNPLFALVPGLGDMPAPPWLQEGLRATYNTRAASLSDFSIYVYRGDDGKGAFGQEHGFGGAGLTQFTIIARDQGKFIGAGMSYTVDINTGNLTPQPAGVSVDVPGAGVIWTSPRGLAAAAKVTMKNLTIVKGTYPENGATHNSITFRWSHDAYLERLVEGIADATYDLDTGLQLYSAHQVTNSMANRTQLTQSEYAGRRYLELPWHADAAPVWTQQVQRLEYHGTVCLQMVGTPNIPMQYSAVFERTDGGPNWTAYTATRYLRGQYNESFQLGCGVNGFPGGPWMPPEALQTLTPGQLLDSDPFTGVKVNVDQIAPGPNGTQLMGFATTMPGTTLIHAYDRADGRLVFIREIKRVGLATQVMELSLARVS